MMSSNIHTLLLLTTLIQFGSTASLIPWHLYPELPISDQNHTQSSPPTSYSPRILNGEPAQEGEWPFMASIQWDHRSHYCGGSVWNANFIVTAAHCMFHRNGTAMKADQVSVYLGHSDIYTIAPAYQIKAAHMIPHEDYDGNSVKGNDIGLIKLVHPIDFAGANKGVRCVCQPQHQKHLIEDVCFVMGWGKLDGGEDSKHSYELQEVKVPLRDEDYCKQNAPGKSFDPATQVCAGYDEGGKDSCQGDSGGPLMCAVSSDPYIYELIGVVSFGAGCGGVRSPGYYTRVSHYREWITNKTGC